MAKGKGVSVASLFDLKSELAKQEAEFAKEKAAGKAYVVGGIKRPDKKPTVWQRQNKGVAARAQRDAEMSVSKPALEDARAALERKAKIYDKLRRGKTGGLDEKQFDSLLVDFDLKAEENGFESDSEDEDESLTVPKPAVDDDPLVEYEDEFGRMRTARRSEVPRHLLHQQQPDIPEEDDPYIMRGRDINYFPTFQQSEDKIAAIKESLVEDPLNLHYDAAQEVRAKGAGFYKFSGDEEERRRQMDALKNARDDTVRTREETGAEDTATAPESSSGSRAMEKRKRDIEERRKVIEAKRRKVAHVEPLPGVTSVPASTPPPAATAAAAADDPFAKLEGQLKYQPVRAAERRTKASANDFSAKLDVTFRSETAAADQFLANLGNEIHHR